MQAASFMTALSPTLSPMLYPGKFQRDLRSVPVLH
jgi:hypothetical protein